MWRRLCGRHEVLSPVWGQPIRSCLMICPRCKNPTTPSFDRECEWCGHVIPMSQPSASAEGAVAEDAVSALQKALREVEREIRANPPQKKGGLGGWFQELSAGLNGEELVTNPIHHAQASVVSHARLPDDRPSILAMLDLAEAQKVATKVAWWDSNDTTEGQEALHKAWKALAQRLEKHLARMSG